MQPIVTDEHGTYRFKQNSIVKFLLDAGPFDMNQIGRLPGITWAERSQFAQLIGYSVSGYGDLSYHDWRHVKEADAIVDEKIEEKER